MNYHQYYPVDIVNGPGTRCTLFVSGCVHECPGCYNKSTWRVNSGMPFTAEMADRIIADLNDTRIKRQGFHSPAAIRCIRRTSRRSSNWFSACVPNAPAKISGSGPAINWMS